MARELVSEKVTIPLDGLSSAAESDGSKLAEDTLNFYPDGEGYLINYPGRRDYFFRDIDDPSPTDPVGTPPSTDKDITRIKIFRDGVGQTHIVFVQAGVLRVVEGNGYRDLYTFSGKSPDGKYYPSLITHEGRLIIANLGDPLMQWDGFRSVVPVGVTETPDPPYVEVGHDPYIDSFPVLSSFVAGDEYKPNQEQDGYWSNTFYWWPGVPPPYVPGANFVDLFSDADASRFENYRPTQYRFCLAFFDKDGNFSRPSAGSNICFVPRNVKGEVVDQTGSDATKAKVEHYDVKHWMRVRWRPPMNNSHINGVVVYRTLDVNPETGNNPETYFTDWIQLDTVRCRHTSISSDAVLSGRDLMDSTVTGPPSTDLAASWGPRLVVRDPNSQESLMYSDITKWGQFRVTNIYKARDKIEAILPIGDRLLIVTHSTSEVLYYDQEGNVRYLETYENKGSYYGRSFSVQGNIAIGLFNDGFFVFDGKEFTEFETPYYIRDRYIDRFADVQRSVVQGEWYFFSCRKDFTSTKNNQILMCHIPTRRWFKISEQVYDLEVYGEHILGVDDSIYFLYRGDSYDESTIHIKGMLTSNVGREGVLDGISILMDPQSRGDVTLKIYGGDEWRDSYKGSAVSYPAVTTMNKSVMLPYFNDDKTTWEDLPAWTSPNDYWIRTELKGTPVGFRHHSKLTFESGKPQRIKAISFEYSAEDAVASKE